MNFQSAVIVVIRVGPPPPTGSSGWIIGVYLLDNSSTASYDVATPWGQLARAIDRPSGLIFYLSAIPCVAAQAVRWPVIQKVSRSRLTSAASLVICSPHYTVQYGALGVLPCVG